MGLFQKIQFYKTLLIGFWCVNIVLIVVTMIASFRFFTSSQNFEASLRDQSKIMSILAFDTELAAVSSLPQKTDDDMYEYRKKVDLLKKSLLVEEGLPSTVKDFAESKKWKLTANEWNDIRTSLLLWVKNQISSSEADYASMNRSTKEMIFLGIITLIIGIVLPILVFAFLTKNILKAKQGFEEKLSAWLAQILKKVPVDAQKPWMSPVLWLEVVLAGFEIFAPQSRHPIILILKDFIPVVRAEYSKAKSEAPIA
jgi:hypothetical protein